MSTISKCLACVLFASCMLQFVACHRETSEQDIDADIRTLVNQTVPADGTLMREARISRGEMRVEADWQIVTNLNRQDYLNELKKKVASEYQVTEQNDSELVLGRLLPGDEDEVRITGFDRSSRQQKLNVHFVGRPD